MTELHVDPFLRGFSRKEKKLLCAGPCSVESAEQIMTIARALAPYHIDMLRGGVWKPRTRPDTFEGVGFRGLRWLKAAGVETGVPVATEVAEPKHIEACLKAGIDIFWIGARTSVNPFAVQAIADSLKGLDIPVMVKNPINPDIELWSGAIERLARVGARRLMAVHRGFSLPHVTRYRNAPLWRIPIELRRRYPQLPIICDPSHICGSTKLIRTVSQEALDLLFDGLMIEVHHDPANALSDARQQITPATFRNLIRKLKTKKPDPTGEEIVQTIHRLRSEIDEIDSDIIDLLARRMRIAEELGLCKNENSVATFQPGRWEQILKSRSREGRGKNLSPEFIRYLFERIHEEALLRQERLLEKMGNG